VTIHNDPLGTLRGLVAVHESAYGPKLPSARGDLKSADRYRADVGNLLR
jgi:hypothetical protein